MARDPYRRQIRRARRAMRHGDDPFRLVIVGPDEPLGLIALAAAGRWAYRHRSAFWPFGITLAAFAVAAYTHPHHARYWIAVAGITLLAMILLGIPHRILWARPAGKVAAGFLSRAWAACGIDRGLERAYTTAVVAVTGGWLSAAIAVGPAVKPLPAIAAIATVVLGIPWWFHRRRRAKVRVERVISGWPDIADNVGLPGSRIVSVVVDAWGWTARVILRKGTTTAHAIARIPDIESGLELRPGSVRVFPDGTHANRLTLRVVETEPLAEPIEWPGPSITSVTQLAEIGLSEDGRPVRVLLLRRNVLVGGITGSGKSATLNVIIAILAACRDVVLWGVDLKGGMELGPWESCFEKIATTPEEARILFRDAVAELNRRAARMAAAGKRLWEPSPADPALVIITDEHTELPAEAHDCADSISRRGRAVAVNLIAATQRPTQAAMGSTAVRSQMDVRICLRVREPRDAALILGQGSVNSGWHAHKLTRPGEFLISDPEHGTPERNRAYLITDERRDQHAARYARHRPWPVGEPQTAPERPQAGERPSPRDDIRHDPETALWAALRAAGPDGVPAASLIRATGMGRTWVYGRLRQWASTGRVIQTIRGHWRAAGPGDSQASG